MINENCTSKKCSRCLSWLDKTPAAVKASDHYRYWRCSNGACENSFHVLHKDKSASFIIGAVFLCAILGRLRPIPLPSSPPAAHPPSLQEKNEGYW